MTSGKCCQARPVITCSRAGGLACLPALRPSLAAWGACFYPQPWCRLLCAFGLGGLPLGCTGCTVRQDHYKTCLVTCTASQWGLPETGSTEALGKSKAPGWPRLHWGSPCCASRWPKQERDWCFWAPTLSLPLSGTVIIMKVVPLDKLPMPGQPLIYFLSP